MLTCDILQPDAEPLETAFEMNDTLYARALVPHTDEVYLWLGANVMLSYPVPEACDLLETKLSGAKQKMADCEEDLDFLREQITVSRNQLVLLDFTDVDYQTLEVATARVYNWDVGQRRKEKAEKGPEDEEAQASNA